MLFVPGSDERKLAKVAELDAPAFILDLEDAVAFSEKAAARERVAAAVGEHGGAAELHVRVNGFESGLLHADVAAVAVGGLAGIVLPKASCARDVEIVEWLLGSLERERDLPAGAIGLSAIVETAAGIERAGEIAAASPRLRHLVFGAGDFSLDLGLDWPPPDGVWSPTLLAAKARVVLASRAAGLEAPHDGVYPDVHDLDGLRAEARAARLQGFGGKHAIHPGQLPVIEEVFAPSAEEIAWAREVVAAFDAHEAEGVAAIRIGGRFVDYPVAERARRLLARAERA
jgi:citrate lyase beta subunit